MAWTILVGGSLGIVVWEIAWAATIGLPIVEFCRGEAISRRAAFSIFTKGVLLLLFTTETTLRLGQVEDQAAQRGIQWCFRPRTYYHERQATLALLAAAIFGWLATDIYFRGESNGLLKVGPTWWLTLSSSIPLLILDPPTVLMVTCALLAARNYWWQRNSTQPAEEPMPPIVLPKFCVLWVFILATTVLSIATLLWLYYTVCLMPR